MFNNVIKKRQKKNKKKIEKQCETRLTVYKSNKHIYAQLYNFNGTNIITSASTLDKHFKEEIAKQNKEFNKTEKASLVGNILAEKIKAKNITKVVFDRSGFKFHGRIKAIADSIKKNGINC